MKFDMIEHRDDFLGRFVLSALPPFSSDFWKKVGDSPFEVKLTINDVELDIERAAKKFEAQEDRRIHDAARELLKKEFDFNICEAMHNFTCVINDIQDVMLKKLGLTQDEEGELHWTGRSDV